jgi:hypothetical protein
VRVIPNLFRDLIYHHGLYRPSPQAPGRVRDDNTPSPSAMHLVLPLRRGRVNIAPLLRRRGMNF